MAKNTSARCRALRQARALHREPDRVRSALFRGDVRFFDPLDKPQVKYEMLRQREVDGAAMQVVSEDFGFTRESYRQILKRFRSAGMSGLFEQKRGRQGPLKADDAVRKHVRSLRKRDPTISPEELARRCKEELGTDLSRRTIYRILAEGPPPEKKQRRRRGARR